MFRKPDAFRQVWGRDSRGSDPPPLATHPGYVLFHEYPDGQWADGKTVEEQYRYHRDRRTLCITALEYLTEARKPYPDRRPDPYRPDVYTRARVDQVSQTEEWRYLNLFIRSNSGNREVLPALADELEELKRFAEKKMEDLTSEHSRVLDVGHPHGTKGYDARQQLLEETLQMVRRLETRVAVQKKTPRHRPSGVTDDEARLYALRQRATELEDAMDLSFGGQ
ncbi:hypothetical protein Q8F55_008246 [Vanrija albida]|uniref:Nucleoporin Nup54 alpha-helical domain-containing protein n=1 Tax=Vanrija albida TaxID=181172 RepID=A0ABR3PVS7_9TREE